MTYKYSARRKNRYDSPMKSVRSIWGGWPAPNRESLAGHAFRAPKTPPHLCHRSDGGHAPAARRNSGARHNIRLRYTAPDVTGFDYGRMALILAVLEKRAGFYFSNLDAYLNVVGGLRIDEPAVDLVVAMALVSSLKMRQSGRHRRVREIGLAGELRAVSHLKLAFPRRSGSALRSVSCRTTVSEYGSQAFRRHD